MASVKGRPPVKTSWKPGQSGNPKGGPKKEWTWAGVVRKAAEKQLKDGRTVKELVAESLTDEAIKGNVPAIKEFGDRIDGRAPQGIGNTDEDGNFQPQDFFTMMADLATKADQWRKTKQRPPTHE